MNAYYNSKLDLSHFFFFFNFNICKSLILYEIVWSFIMISYSLQVWKYRDTQKLVDGALEQIYATVQTPEGRTQTDLLLTGGINGSLRYRQGNVILTVQDTKSLPE